MADRTCCNLNSPESAAFQSLVSRPQRGQLLTDMIDVLQTKELNGNASVMLYGLVNDKEIKSVEVRWNDEMVQSEEVINDSFLAIRKGKSGMSNVTGFDADGNVIYSFEAPEPAPGKN
jgi:hypothetical protein